jgi:hypothetical protein
LAIFLPKTVVASRTFRPADVSDLVVKESLRHPLWLSHSDTYFQEVLQAQGRRASR